MTPAQQQQIRQAMHRAERLKAHDLNDQAVKVKMIAEGYPAAAVRQALDNLRLDKPD